MANQLSEGLCCRLPQIPQVRVTRGAKSGRGESEAAEYPLEDGGVGRSGLAVGLVMGARFSPSVRQCVAQWVRMLCLRSEGRWFKFQGRPSDVTVSF